MRVSGTGKKGGRLKLAPAPPTLSLLETFATRCDRNALDWGILASGVCALAVVMWRERLIAVAILLAFPALLAVWRLSANLRLAARLRRLCRFWC